MDTPLRLFQSRFRAQLDNAFEQRLFSELSLPVRAPNDTDHSIRQSYIQRIYDIGEVSWIVRTQWDGAVGVSATLSGSILMHGSLFDLILLPGWRLAADLVAALGGYGDARVCIGVEVRAIAANLGTFYRGLPGQTEVTRWCGVAEPDGDLIGSVQRELQRAAGLWSFEGQPDPPPGVVG